MCLSTDYFDGHNPPAPMVALEDMPVLKVLRVDPQPGWDAVPLLFSPYKWEPYVLGEDKEAEFSTYLIRAYDERYVLIIEAGLHSFLRYEAAEHCCKCRIEMHEDDEGAVSIDYRIFNAVIPKGSEYYRGLDGDMVSTKLRVVSEYVKGEPVKAL